MRRTPAPRRNVIRRCSKPAWCRRRASRRRSRPPGRPQARWTRTAPRLRPPRSIWPTRGLHRRSTVWWACARSTPATSSTQPDTTGLLVVTQLQPIAVIFTLPEDQLPQVQALLRQGRTLVVDAYDRANANHLATGTLLTLDNQIDTTTGTAKLKAVFDNRDGALFPNQFVNIRLILEQRQRAIVIPTPALQSGSQGSFVYVVKPGDPPASLSGGATTSPGDQPHHYVEARPVTVNPHRGGADHPDPRRSAR